MEKNSEHSSNLEDALDLARSRITDCLTHHRNSDLHAACLHKRTAVLVAGDDAINFLNGLTTNDIARAQRAQYAITTAFLTPQGSIKNMCIAIPIEEGVIIECELAGLKDFANYLWHARMEDAVTFRWMKEMSIATLFPKSNKQLYEVSAKDELEGGANIIPLGRERDAKEVENSGFLCKDPRAPLKAWRLYHARADDLVRSIKLPIASNTDYENYRLSLGIVENADELAQPRAFPFEYGLDALAALDWQKACYVGQEITARMKYRARETKKHALPLRIACGNLAVKPDDKVYCVTEEGHENSKQLEKLCGEITYVVDNKSGDGEGEGEGEGTSETTTALALCRLAPIKQALRAQKTLEEDASAEDAVNSLNIKVALGSEKNTRRAKLILPHWLAMLFSQKQLAQSKSSKGESSQDHRVSDGTRGTIAMLMLALLCGSSSASAEQSLQYALQQLQVQKPYRISLFARAKGARTLAVAEEIGSVFIATRARRIYIVKDGTTHLLSDNLNVPNGIVWRSPYLYVIEQDKVSRHRFDEFSARLPAGDILFDALPNKKHHGWRVATIGPDDRLYIAIGAPCNICSVQGMEGTIIRMELDGSGVEVYASGIRNSIGMDFQPSSDTLFFTDNGADFMGNDSPPEELNRASRKGLFFGYPWFGGGRDRTKKFANTPIPDELSAKGVTFPIDTFPAHNAPLGIHFYRGERFEDLKGDALVALHGSWNRAPPDGYRVVRLHFEAGDTSPSHQSIFIDGFLNMQGGRGRPVDLKTHWDGSILLSDDARGLVYRIERE